MRYCCYCASLTFYQLILLSFQTAKSLEANLNNAGVENEIHIYPGQGHAFVNSSEEAITRKLKQGNPEHDQAAVDLAWSRVESWFQKFLV